MNLNLFCYFWNMLFFWKMVKHQNPWLKIPKPIFLIRKKNALSHDMLVLWSVCGYILNFPIAICYQTADGDFILKHSDFSFFLQQNEYFLSRNKKVKVLIKFNEVDGAVFHSKFRVSTLKDFIFICIHNVNLCSLISL